MTEPTGRRYRPWIAVAMFFASVLWISIGVSGPGLTWDEPAYRNSQVRLGQWAREELQSTDFNGIRDAFAPDTIDFYWEFNRHGPNFHPPMASYLNLATHAAFGNWVDDLASRRLSSCIELAAMAAMLCHFLGHRYGVLAGVVASLCLVTTPRVLGDAHIMGTDIPMAMFWTMAALSFWNALERRRWQWVLGAALGCLFLVKFNGAAAVIPIALSFIAYALRHATVANAMRWFAWTALIAIPMTPLFIAIAGGFADDSRLASIAKACLENSTWISLLFLWPLVVVILHAFLPKPTHWPVGLEATWVAMAVAPLVAILLNPTWWHDPLVGLASYFELNLGRKGHLPDIGIYYLGDQYNFSLPWHNAWVLMAVTIPWGTLVLGIVGVVYAVIVSRANSLGVYLLAHAVTLPVVRMFDVPAHDGVRLFLPTFVFWAALAGLGAHAVVSRWPKPYVVGLVFVVGPVWAAVDAARYHPYELSYYNIGLPLARRIGFEVTYWYDAVTPSVLRDLNRRLPAGAVLAFPSPSINPEVFSENQSQGKLRADLTLDPSKSTGFPYMLLLTHSSKATPFTRMLYAMKPWYESRFHGLRMFSVVDPRSTAVAWALISMAKPDSSIHDRSRSFRHESILEVESAVVRRAGGLLADRGVEALQYLAGEPAEVDYWVRRWMRDPDMLKVIAKDAPAIRIAANILADRPRDVRSVLESLGYPREEDFGGAFDAGSAP